MKVLLERTTAGFTVEVGLIETTGEWVLKAWTDSYRARVPVLPEQAAMAFRHPCSFLPYSDRFFRALKEGESEDETALPANGGGHSLKVLDYCAVCEQSLLAHESGSHCDNCAST